MKQKIYTLQYLAKFLQTEFHGDPDCMINGIGSLINASHGQISFLQNSHYKRYLSTTNASAVIMRSKDLDHQNFHNVILVKDPYFAYAKISILFDDTPIMSSGIHETALIGANCKIGNNVSIGPYCVIGNKVIVNDGVQINANCVIGDEVIIGEGTKICANVTLYHKVELGKRVLLHSGVVIGSDGFGNANDEGVWCKIYQLGTVIIGNDVEIGANSTIDRGAIENTIIDDGVKLDNLVQIGHNVHIGAHTAIAGCTGIAGSTEIGKYCMIGGGVGINGHIKIADRVIITGMTSVRKSITKSGGIYASAIPAMQHRTWWRIIARIMQLEDLIRSWKILEKS
ncbi:MAG: UDP-3-O-(3-hydroxymyristoyl)glucosamine N-acyltransferase [Coxiellaceae bacterium]|jgi:UDP-3-O-[3-hydroxymyristoyl] glucosamine N-acyltransferase|nr:UDP-3-O-(3-hydroxymyristoyl)glucosamine N-acyltransferase [Coxiellaceae bacterium]